MLRGMALNLPYNSAGWHCLPHYLRYLVAPAAAKTNWLMQLAEKDQFFSPIVTMLKEHGHYISHPYFGRSGAYQPATLVLTEHTNLQDAIATLQDKEVHSAEFQFSARHGGAQTAHYFLHELVHFWQDIHGLFLTPLEAEGHIPTMLDATSHILVTCICEAMAETEALRASWRLKEAGYPIAWQGAGRSMDWQKHARAYAQDMGEMTEAEAALRAFLRWHDGHQRHYYEARALTAYQDMLHHLPQHQPAELTPKFRHIHWQTWLQMMPAGAAPNYLSTSTLSNAQTSTIQCPNTAKAANALGVSENSTITDITIGSAAYLWHTKRLTKELTQAY